MYPTTARLLTDLFVTSEDGTTQLVIEVKRSARPELAEAAQAMRELVAASSPVCFFLFISTQKFWVWNPASAVPAYEGDTEALLTRYINLKKVPLATLGGREFILLVYSWLGSIIFKPAETLLKMPGQEWLVTTGLQPLIHRGYIHLEGEAN
ncbi:hypothetical protein QMK33_12120 [Hymenobacter sp. H14-R3]|uniref:hypothetical protein n=1 Tax=Hymenobacter sp. H14-R3 TaxID=3046308 RepID=UPI0024B92BC5|nr:hypothetical protein [Hymenobacter sp. H14-R3]MDJ0365900.1 hypothetical protein [Hymenobacter sp. H14-R3]